MKSFLHIHHRRFRLWIIAIAGLWGFWVCLLLADYLWPLPLSKGRFATVVTDNQGYPLRVFPGDDGVWRYPVTLDQVSQNYLDALLAYEDQWFWYHPGVNPAALARALWQNLRHGRVVSGGSTLTMQVARLMDPHKKTIPGKLKQMIRAFQLEYHLNKTQILTWYLNHAPFGGTIEGVEAAAFAYLGKSAKELSHAQAALLSILPQAPSMLRPDRSPDKAQKARNKVLDRLETLEIWAKDIIQEARQEPIFVQHPDHPMDCPLLSRLLYTTSGRQNILQTTIDRQIQYQLKSLARQYAFHLPEKSSLAILVVDNRTLGIKAYVGSADFHDSSRFGHVDMVQAIRSPGSTLKPFLYGLALDGGLIHSQSLLTDAPRINSRYRPGNFTDGFSGPVSVTTALQHSLNVPAVQVLEAYGPQAFADRLRNAGLILRFPDHARANIAMILGGVGTNLVSLVSGYTALARDGKAGELRYLKDDPLKERYLISPGAAWIVRDMLRHPFPGEDMIHLMQHTKGYAWKTGTSYGFRDAWAVAVTNACTIGIWIGRPDGTPTPGHYGSGTAAPLLRQVIEILDLPADELPRPGNVEEAVICWPSGLKKSDCLKQGIPCHQEKRAWILNDQIPPTLPDPNSSLIQAVQTLLINPDTGNRVNRACASEQAIPVRIALWPKSLEPWLPKKWRRSSLIPPADDTCSQAPNLAGSDIHITGIADAAILAGTSNQQSLPSLQLSAMGGIGQRFWYLNGTPVAQTNHPQEIIFHPLTLPGHYQLAVVDEAGNYDQVTFDVYPQ